MVRAPCVDQKNGLKKGPWTPEEDHKLISYIQIHGHGNWRNLPKNAGLVRCGKSCRLRWTNYLKPDIKRGSFSFEEEESIIQLHSFLGNKWSTIASSLPGRTDNEIKNYWNTHIRKRLLRNGIDPVTHAPRLDLLDFSTIFRSNFYNSSALLHLSNHLGTQAPLNPELFRLASNFLSLKQENPETVLQFLQQNQQLFDFQMQNQIPPLNQYQFHTPISESQTCSKLNGSLTSLLDQTLLTQADLDGLLSSSTHFKDQTFQENLIPSSFNETSISQPNQIYCNSNATVHVLSDQSSRFQSFNNNNGNQNFSFDNSVFSTPLLSTSPVNSSSKFINRSATEDERETDGSRLLKFEIPKGLDINDFM